MLRMHPKVPPPTFLLPQGISYRYGTEPPVRQTGQLLHVPPCIRCPRWFSFSVFLRALCGVPCLVAATPRSFPDSRRPSGADLPRG